MNVGQIRRTVARYFEVAASEFITDDEDLIIIGMNSARKKAELLHDFEVSKVSVDLVVDDVTGGVLSSAVLAGTSGEGAVSVNVKSVIAGGVFVDDVVSPVRFSTTTSVDKDRVRVGRECYDDELRYPSDATFSGGFYRDRRPKILQFGNTIFKYPFGNTGETSTLRLQVYKWFDDYTVAGEDDDPGTGDTYTDLFTEHGHDYLKWATIVEVNHLMKEFVPRQEGNLSPHKAFADEALAALISWDEYIVEGART